MLTTLQRLVSNPQKALLLFDETLHHLFLAYAIPLIQSGISVGVISTTIANALKIKIKKTKIEGVYTTNHTLSKPSILCFSSGSKNSQKGIVRTYESWQHSFNLIKDELLDFPKSKAIVLGELPYSLSLFGAMESLLRGQQPLVFPNHEIRYFTQRLSNQNYILWVTPLHCSFFIKAFENKIMEPIHTIKYVFVGGAQFSNNQRSKLQKVFPKAKIYSFYGASETSFIALKYPQDNSNSVGHICKGVQVSIRNEAKQKMPENSVGSIWVKSCSNFDSYLDKSLKINTLDSYISISDLGFLDDQNRLFFAGRAERHISIKGHIIDLNALERWYKDILAIETLALLGQSNEEKENELVLLTTQQLTPKIWQSLKKKAQHALGTQAVPKKWLHCQSWPLLANGKTDYITLLKCL